MLPDRRLRVARIYDVLNNIPKDPATLLADVWLPWGTADDEFPNCRLIKQDVAGQPPAFPDDSIKPPYLTRVFEEIPATAEVVVGNPDVTVNQYGYKEVTIHSIQFSSGTAVYGVPGTTTGPAPWTALILRDQVDTDDGTLRVIKRTYIEGGRLATYEEIKFGGALLLHTIKSLLIEPTADAGFTLVTRSKEYAPNGAIVFSYGYASASGSIGGGGEIDRKVEYLISPDEGVTGVTRTTITFLTDLTVSSNPITPPPGSVLISLDKDTADGFIRWTAVYASGQGEISSDVDIRNGGKLIVYKKSAINAVPSDPGPTIGGTVTLITTNVRNGGDATDGVVIYDYQWAEGIGTISEETTYNQSSDEGSNGVTVVTTKALTALGGSNPVLSPGAGYVLISFGSTEQDGYLLWNVVYALGQGTVTTETDSKDGNKLILYHIVALGTAPSAPAPTIGGTVVQISTAVRESEGYQIFDYRWAEGLGQISEDVQYSQSLNQGTIGVTVTRIRYLVAPAATVQPTSLAGSTLVGQSYEDGDGYRIWNTTWGKGTGLVLDETTIQVSAALVVYHRVALGSAPTTPSATIGGTVTVFDTSVRKADGYEIFDYRWAEGDGQSSIETRGEPDGALLYSVTTFTAAAATPAYPGGGTAYLLSLEQSPQGGYFRNQAVYKKPPADQTRRQTVEWQRPGFAGFSGTQLSLSPPITIALLASIEVTYSTSQDTTVPWALTGFAGFVYSYVTSPLKADGTKAVGTETIVTPSQAVSGQKGLGGYSGFATSVSGTNALYNGVLCDSYLAVIVSSTPFDEPPTGLTVLKNDNEPYLTATDGTVVWRRTKISYTF